MPQQTWIEQYFPKQVEEPPRLTQEQVDAQKDLARYEKKQEKFSQKYNKLRGEIADSRAKNWAYNYAGDVQVAKAHTMISAAQAKANEAMGKLAGQHAKQQQAIADANAKAKQEVSQYQSDFQEAGLRLFGWKVW